MKIKKKKNGSKDNVIVFIIYLFSSLIIPSTAISFFAMADKNIKEKKEIIYNDKEIMIIIKLMHQILTKKKYFKK